MLLGLIHGRKFFGLSNFLKVDDASNAKNVSWKGVTLIGLRTIRLRTIHLPTIHHTDNIYPQFIY
jgi:hypothetical protein